jgi:hypothetical protein
MTLYNLVYGRRNFGGKCFVPVLCRNLRFWGNSCDSTDIERKEHRGMQVEGVSKGNLLEPMERKGQKAVLN